MNEEPKTSTFDVAALEKIEAEFDGSKEARAGFNSIRQTALSLGGVDPGETPGRAAAMEAEIFGGGMTAEGLDRNAMEDFMKIAPAEPDEIARIMFTTLTARQGDLVTDRHGVPHIYDQGVFHPVPDLLKPPAGAVPTIMRFMTELREVSRALADWEEHFICTRVARLLAQIQVSKLADHEEIVPGLPAGLARAALNKFRAAAGAKNPNAAMAKHRAARNAAIADDEINKAWKRLAMLLPVVELDTGTVGGVGASVVGPDAVLRTDGSIALHDPAYLATRAVEWNVLLPHEANDPEVHAAMAAPSGYQPPDTLVLAKLSLFLAFMMHLAGCDRATVQHILGLIGAKLAKRNIGQRGLLLFGATGTGKSVLIKVLHVVFGGGAEAVDVTVMTGQKHDAATIAKLITRRPSVLSCSEFQAAKGGNDYGLLKSIIAGDPVPARRIYTDQVIHGKLDALVVLASNRLPNMANDASAAILRRLDPLYIPANLTVSGKAEDRDLAAKLAKEAPIIARVLLTFGAHFDPSADLPLKMQESRDLADTTIAPKIKQFLADACIVDPTGFIPTNTQPGWSLGLSAAFEQWHLAEYGEYANISPEGLKAAVIDAGKGKFQVARVRPPGAGRSVPQVRGTAGLSLKPSFSTAPARLPMAFPTPVQAAAPATPTLVAPPSNSPATP